MHDHSLHADTTGSHGLIEWIPVLLVTMILVAYVTGVLRQHRDGRSWSHWRTTCFLAGALVLATTLSPAVTREAHNDIRAHMAQHLLIGMVAPLGLALGAPMSLLLRSIPATTGRKVARQLRRRPVHLLSHPVTALILNLGGMYPLYLTPLFAHSMETPVLHHLVNAHFLAAGYVFAWSIAGPDPAPGRPAFRSRLAVLVVSLGLHAFLGKFMYAHLYPRDFTADAEQIREAALIMYYGGDIAEMLLAIALFGTWYAGRRRRRFKFEVAAASERYASANL